MPVALSVTDGLPLLVKEPLMFETIFRGKGIFDGAKDIPEMISLLDSAKAELEAMHRAGIVLQDEACDDYPTLVTDDPEVAKQFGLEEGEPDDEDLESEKCGDPDDPESDGA
jgi:hypothetical protein